MSLFNHPKCSFSISRSEQDELNRVFLQIIESDPSADISSMRAFIMYLVNFYKNASDSATVPERKRLQELIVECNQLKETLEAEHETVNELNQKKSEAETTIQTLQDTIIQLNQRISEAEHDSSTETEQDSAMVFTDEERSYIDPVIEKARATDPEVTPTGTITGIFRLGAQAIKNGEWIYKLPNGKRLKL